MVGVLAAMERAMAISVIGTLGYTLVPSAAVVLALCVGLMMRPVGSMINSIQACAAGVLLSGIAVEFLPQLHFARYSVSLSLFFFLGLALMLALNRLNPGCCSSQVKSPPLLPFVTGFSIEFFVNGMVIALSVLAGHFAVLLAAVSLAVCCFVCGLSVTTRFITVKLSMNRTVFGVMLMALAFPVGGLLGLVFVAHLPAIWVEDAIAFGMAVMLYIATVDLLMEAFRTSNNFPKIMFFIGFILILLMKAKVVGH